MLINNYLQFVLCNYK